MIGVNEDLSSSFSSRYVFFQKEALLIDGSYPWTLRIIISESGVAVCTSFVGRTVGVQQFVLVGWLVLDVSDLEQCCGVLLELETGGLDLFAITVAVVVLRGK